MKTMKMRLKPTASILFWLVLGIVNAQPGWNWGSQPDIAREKNALYSDMVKSGRYEEAIEPHSWLVQNTPDLNESLYQNGAKIYESLADQAINDKNTEKTNEYATKALEMYDLRIKYFGKEDYVLNRKVFPAYKYFKTDKSKFKELYDMYNRAFELNQTEFYISNLVGYMDIVRKYKSIGGKVSDEEVIDIYSRISDVLESQRAKNKNLDQIDKISDTVDKIFTATIDLSCDLVESILGPKLSASKDIKIAKKAFQLMLTGKCTDRPLAFEAASIINENEPTFGISKFLASKAASNGDKATSLKYFTTAIELTDDNTSKAEIHLLMARVHVSSGEKQDARRQARQALAYDPNFKDAYSLIGDLYMTSFDECKGNEKKTNDYALFIAAYNQYKKAGDTAGMAKAKALFPSIEDIFNEGYQEGQSFQVGCWINEAVVIERRPDN